MSKSLRCLFLVLMMIGFQSCDKPTEYQINSDQDLINLFNQEYIKVHFNSAEFKQESCANFIFEFDEVKVIKISENEFKSLVNQLKNQKLDPLQIDGQFDLSLEVQGVKYCMNNLGQLYRNNRKLVDQIDLVYDIKSEVGFYNYFDEQTLVKNDSIIAKKGLPFSYKLFEPEVRGELLENNIINKKVENLKTSHNLIITYK